MANINQITNIDLIYPGTVLTATYNADNQAVSVKVETPSSETSDTPVVAEANLTTNEVTVNGQSVVASDLSAPVETVSLTATQAPATEESTQAVSEVTEAIASASDTQLTQILNNQLLMLLMLLHQLKKHLQKSSSNWNICTS